jgi:formate dehydrogenase beta subunit
LFQRKCLELTYFIRYLVGLFTFHTQKRFGNKAVRKRTGQEIHNGQGEKGSMINPYMTTWDNGNKIIETVQSLGEKKFPGFSPKALMGWNGIVIWDPDTDPVPLLQAYLGRVAAESCGRCIPCREGTLQLADIMNRICVGQGRKGDLYKIRTLVSAISLSAKCDIGKSVAKPVFDLIDRFTKEFDDVIKGLRPVKADRYESTVTAPCINACPAHVDIPAYLENVKNDRWPEAMEIVRRGCPMPGTIGRVCVRPCEENCRRKDLDEPLSIRAIKRFLSEQEQFNGMRATEPEHPRWPENVAVVGAGPSGLACAYYLGRLGYGVTVLESQEAPGGMAAFGIPSYRLPRDVIAHEVRMIETMGAEIRYGVHVGKDTTLEDLTESGYRAVYLAMGAPESSMMRCKGETEGYTGFMAGIDFLAKAARGESPLTGNRIVVVGGGNVAMDCVRTARRLGFSDVNLLYRRTEDEMPADRHEIHEAKEEGVVFHFLAAPVEILAENGKITGLMCLRMELGEPDSSGRRSPVSVPGSEYVIPCDAVIPAVGQKCAVDSVVGEKELVASWKTLVVDQTSFQSQREEIFGGGDCVTGPATLIAALAAGKSAARNIDQYLREGRCTPQKTDYFDILVSSGRLFNEEEPFPFPGISLREEPEIMDPEQRVCGFDEVEKGLSAAQARHEAGRCLRCYRILLTAE